MPIKSNRLSLIFIVLGIIFLVITIISLAILNSLFHFDDYIKTWGSYKTADEYHQHSKKELAQAEATTKEQVDSISFSGNKLFNKGVDKGCTVGPITSFGSSIRDVHCYYEHTLVFQGSGNLEKDLSEFYRLLNKAGWSSSSTGIDTPNIDKTGKYVGPASVGFKKPTSMEHSNFLDLNIVDTKDIHFFDRDVLYGEIAQEYLKNPKDYIIEVKDRYVYLTQQCTICEMSESSK